MQVLGECLGGAKSTLLRGIQTALLRPELEAMRTAIAAIAADEAACSNTSALTTMQLCYCVKSDANKFLDSARAAFNSLTEELHAKVRPLPDNVNDTARTCGRSAQRTTRLGMARLVWSLVFKRKTCRAQPRRLEPIMT